MVGRTFISFDWAIKKVLRHKENFTVLEGFLSELLGFDIKIQNLLESEANKQHENDKFDRVDILVKSQKGELLLIEVQYKKIIDTMDEWMYFLKKSEIKDEFTAKGMNAAKEVLRYENMQPEDQIAYKRHIENRRIEKSVTETAKDMGKREKAIEVAKFLLSEKASLPLIIGATQLTAQEIEKIAKGEDIDKEEEYEN